MKNNQKGFTIIELLVATTVFSVVLLITLAGFMEIGRTFFKGIIIARTNNTTRTIVDSISSDIRYSHYGSTEVAFNDANNYSYFCVGDNMYMFKKGFIYESVPAASTNHSVNGHGLLKRHVTSCEVAQVIPDDNKNQELLGENMRVSNLSLSCAGGISYLCTINLKIAYGDDDLLYSPGNLLPAGTADQASDVLCKGELAGSQFCATSELSTSVLRGG